MLPVISNEQTSGVNEEQENKKKAQRQLQEENQRLERELQKLIENNKKYMIKQPEPIEEI